MSTDRELLELAASAAGIELKWSTEPDLSPRRADDWLIWNPLTDDGDALRLAVKLGLTVEVDLCYDATRVSETECELIAKHMHFDGGPEAATRRAIVRAAAEIGKQTSTPGSGEGASDA